MLPRVVESHGNLTGLQQGNSTVTDATRALLDKGRRVGLCFISVRGVSRYHAVVAPPLASE